MNELEFQILTAGLKSCGDKKDLDNWVENELAHISNDYPVFAHKQIKCRVTNSFNCGDFPALNKTALEMAIEAGLFIMTQIKEYYEKINSRKAPRNPPCIKQEGDRAQMRIS